MNNNYEDLFYKSLRIREVEKKIIELYPSDLIQSPVHLSIGQEAVAVGVCTHLCPDDWVFINYRGHAFYLAKGGPLPDFFSEMMGRRQGICKGKGGSMHLAAPEQGIMGASAVVASTISHAVGSALVSKIRNEKRVFVADFGDGAMEQGVFHESLNFAALHRVPVLFLCQDNGLAVHARLQERQSFNLSTLISAYGIPYYEVKEGYDLMKVCEISKIAIQNVREIGSPVFLKINIARYREHVGPGEDFNAGYRSESEMEEWKNKDPLIHETQLIEHFRPKIEKEINEALKIAKQSPFPTQEDLLTDVL